MLSRNEIKKVVAISSSVLYEAKFFGKDIEYLYQPVIDENYIIIYKEYFNTSFWIDILSLDNKIEIIFKFFIFNQLCAEIMNK